VTGVQWLTRFTELVDDWSYLSQRDGWRATLPLIGQEAARLPYRRLRFAVPARSLLEPLPDLQPKIALEIRVFQPADLALVRQINRPSEAGLYQRRLERGHTGLIAFHAGKPAGYAWGCPEIDPGLERAYWKLEPGDVFCVDAYTAPAFRGHGVQTALTLARFRLFRDLGYQRAIAYIEVHNHPSLAVWNKFGSQIIGYIDFMRLGPWRRTHHSVPASSVSAS
jgi:GNAT superfamily N-acetyltransferase